MQSFRREETVNVKPKKKELQDFYRFQIRQKKVGELVELRKKFEEVGWLLFLHGLCVSTWYAPWSY